MEMETPLQTVIVGLGRAGWDIHWRELLKAHPQYRVVGVVEPLADRRRQAEQEIGCRSFASLNELLANPVGELVVIATPSGGHGPEGLACLARGLHVVLDKPMCQGVAEADALIARSREMKRLVTCFHPQRYYANIVLMRQVIGSGKLGRIVEIKCNRSGFSRRNDWIMRRAPGGGLHNVWGSHSVDCCLLLAGSPPKEVFSDLQNTVTPGDADDHCKIVIRCQNGILIDAEISNSMIFPPRPEWMIAGTTGGMITEQEGLRVRFFDPARTPPLQLVDGPAPDRRYGNDDVLPWQEELIPYPDQENPGRRPFYDNLYRAIRHGAALHITPESVREQIAVLELCRQQNPAVWGESR